MIMIENYFLIFYKTNIYLWTWNDNVRTRVITYNAWHHLFHDECHSQWHDSSYQNKWHMLSSVSLYIMCVMICASTRDAYHRWCYDMWHDSYQNMWCVPQPVSKHMICVTASTMIHAMSQYAMMSQFASKHIMHVTTHVIMHTITNVIMSHILSRHMMHVIAHAMTLDVYHGYVIDLPWLVSWHIMHVVAHAMTLDVCHGYAITLPWHIMRALYFIFLNVLKISNFYMWYFIFNHFFIFIYLFFIFKNKNIFYLVIIKHVFLFFNPNDKNCSESK